MFKPDCLCVPVCMCHYLSHHLKRTIFSCVQSKVSAEVSDIGFKQAMQQKWLATDKSSGAPRIVRKVRGETGPRGRQSSFNGGTDQDSLDSTKISAISAPTSTHTHTHTNAC